MSILIDYIIKNKDIDYNSIDNIEKYVGMTDEYGNTALMCYLSKVLYPDVIKISQLLRKEIGMVNNNNETALMNYIEKRNSISDEIIRKDSYNIDIIKLLSKEIGILSNKDVSALTLYIKNNTNIDSDILKLLLKEINIKYNCYYNKPIYIYYNTIDPKHIDAHYINLLMPNKITRTIFNESLRFRNYIKIHNTFNSIPNSMTLFHMIIKDSLEAKTSLMKYVSLSIDHDISIVKYLINDNIEKDSFIDYIKFNDLSGRTALTYYVCSKKCNNLEIVKLLSSGLGKVDRKGITAFMCYITYYENYQKDIFNILVKEKNVYTEKFFSTLEFYIKFSKDIDLKIIELLKDQIYIKSNDCDDSMLILYLKRKNIVIKKEIVEYLFDKLKYYQNKYNDTALHTYLKYQKDINTDIINLLYVEGHYMNNEGLYPYDIYKKFSKASYTILNNLRKAIINTNKYKTKGNNKINNCISKITDSFNNKSNFDNISTINLPDTPINLSISISENIDDNNENDISDNIGNTLENYINTNKSLDINILKLLKDNIKFETLITYIDNHMYYLSNTIIDFMLYNIKLTKKNKKDLVIFITNKELYGINKDIFNLLINKIYDQK